MKKSILFLFLITLSVQLFSQKFKVFPNGIHSESDSSKNFVILEYKDKSAKELYNSVKIYITKTSLHQPRVFLGDIPDTFLRTKSYTDNIASFKNRLGDIINIEGEFVTTFEFKDNKIKISLSDLYLPNNGGTQILVKSYITHPRIFNLDGTEAKNYLGIRASLEGFINSKLQLLNNYITGKNNDW